MGGWGGQIDNVELFELQDWGYFHKSWKIEQLRAKVQSLREAYVKMTYDQRNRHLISLLWDAETHQVIAAPYHSSPAPAGQTWRQWRSLTLSVGGYPTVLDVAVEAHARQVLQDGLSPIRGPDQRFARDSLVRGRLGPNFGGLFLVLGGVVGCRALWLAHRAPRCVACHVTASAGRSRTPGCSPLTSMACAAIETVGSARRTSYPRNRSASLRRWLTASRGPSQRRPRVAPYTESASPPVRAELSNASLSSFPLSSPLLRAVPPVHPFLLSSTHNAVGCARALPPPSRR